MIPGDHHFKELTSYVFNNFFQNFVENCCQTHDPVIFGIHLFLSLKKKNGTSLLPCDSSEITSGVSLIIAINFFLYPKDIICLTLETCINLKQFDVLLLFLVKIVPSCGLRSIIHLLWPRRTRRVQPTEEAMLLRVWHIVVILKH